MTTLPADIVAPGTQRPRSFSVDQEQPGIGLNDALARPPRTLTQKQTRNVKADNGGSDCCCG